MAGNQLIIRSQQKYITGGKVKKIAIGLIIIMSFALIISCSTEEETAKDIIGAPFHATFIAAQAEAKASGKDILIDFYSDS
ncbi:MAG: hypothetical protein DRP35_04490 [Candidatus Zixiibacteriota bacterium]|nr:MAG: hypothetical protein DRP35_04490 [candidate division Zixibacteria bacterium]